MFTHQFITYPWWMNYPYVHSSSHYLPMMDEFTLSRGVDVPVGEVNIVLVSLEQNELWSFRWVQPLWDFWGGAIFLWKWLFEMSRAVIHGVNAHRLHCQEVSMGAWCHMDCVLPYGKTQACGPTDRMHGNPPLVLPLFNTTLLLRVHTTDMHFLRVHESSLKLKTCTMHYTFCVYI